MTREHECTSNAKARKSTRRELRQHMTPAEAALWSMLKNKQLLGSVWRRQFSIGFYILDFYCPGAKLAVEVDGSHHYMPDGQFNDERRTEHLWQEHGIRVIRFENDMIFQQPHHVIETIRQALTAISEGKSLDEVGL